MYVPLWVKTNHSFLEGASFPEELVDRAQALGLPALAVTDWDGVYGLARAHVRAKEIGLRLVAGAQVTVERPGSRGRLPETTRLVLLARTHEGYGTMCRLLSLAQARCPKGEARATVREVAEHAAGILALAPDPDLLEPLREPFGRDLFAFVTRHLRAEEQRLEARLRAEAARLGVALVGGHEVLYHARARRPLQDVLTCIRHGVTLASAGTRIAPNAEHDLLPPAVLAARFADEPALLARSVEVADRCTFDLSQVRYRYPSERLPDGRTETEHLRALTLEGARARYDGMLPEDVLAQLDRELALIEELDYGGYFLTMHEVVVFCRAQGILCQGRGSAANSAVCYCLGITAVDPVRMELLFERFLSRERAEPPDIDLDIEHERREEVIQHVYARWGRRHAAMVANVIRYRARSAVRDVGKVLGIPATEVDAVARNLGHYDALLDDALLDAAGLDPEAPSSRQLLALVRAILDFPRHLSIHPGGFLLGHAPVDTLVPIEPATMEGRTVIQWDKYDVEALGLFKVDLLGLGSLTVIHGALDLLRAHHGVDIDMAQVPAEDPETYAMVCAADTVGVFQIESRAQMAMLPRLRPRTFYDLVIEVAIVRPGPIQGDMVHPYLRRRSGEERVDYPHPSLEQILRKTLGVPIFQEQVMKLAIVAADYTPGEADQLRRDMAAWRSAGRIEEHRRAARRRAWWRAASRATSPSGSSPRSGALASTASPRVTRRRFALLAYVTAWLRCHYPSAFTCALLNAQPMGFYAPSTIVEDARRHRVAVRPVDVCTSGWDCTLERAPGPDGHALRMGLRYVKGLGERERAHIEPAALAAPFSSLEDFARRTHLGERALVALAEAGAFEAFAPRRRDALWQVRALARHAHDALPIAPAPARARFASLDATEHVLWDYRASDHSARGHPMARFRATLARRGIPDAQTVRAMRDGAFVDYVGMVICRQRPSTKSGVTFFTLEDETGFVNLVVWRPVFERFATVARLARVLGVWGRLQVANGTTHLVAEALRIADLSDDGGSSSTVTPRSRDFH